MNDHNIGRTLYDFIASLPKWLGALAFAFLVLMLGWSIFISREPFQIGGLQFGAVNESHIQMPEDTSKLLEDHAQSISDLTGRVERIAQQYRIMLVDAAKSMELSRRFEDQQFYLVRLAEDYARDSDVFWTSYYLDQITSVEQSLQKENKERRIVYPDSFYALHKMVTNQLSKMEVGSGKAMLQNSCNRFEDITGIR